MGTAVITGSASGIGACVKARLEAQGFEIIGIDLKGEAIDADLSTVDGRQAAIDQALNMSNGKIDRLVLAAGLGGHLDDGALVARVNYFGAVSLVDGLRDALEQTNGRCVVIGSNSAQMRTNADAPMVEAMLAGDEEKAVDVIGDFHAATVYGHSKHALTRAVRRRAQLWGERGISINVIAPGPTETPMLNGVKEHPTISKSLDMIPIPQKRFARPDEIAEIIEFLLSDTADYMQGSVIYVDGGTDAQIRPDAF